MNSRSKAHILIIDDEPDMINGFSSLLSAFGYSSAGASDEKTSLALIEENEFDIIFCDYFMPAINGIDLIKVLQKVAPQTPIVIFTAFGTIERAVTAMKAGAFDFLEKPVDPDKLNVILEKALAQRELFKEKKNLIDQLQERFGFDNIIAISPAMKKIFLMVENIAASDANVLITGESGTGKELIARSIHAHSGRKTKPFVPVNCGAFPENLFEAELFGYEKGAYTGAAQRKIGLLEYADGGTFFLDEVCEMNPSLQVKLLRVLQDHQLRRIGGNELKTVNFRVISATNRDINTWLEKGLLRRDFYYRLNVIHIHVPPLRERKDDILLLAEHFLAKSNIKTGKKVESLSSEVKDFLEKYSWPGNVRELENIIERAVILSQDNNIKLSSLPSGIGIQNSDPENLETGGTLSEIKNRTVSELEIKYLKSLLEKHKGNVTKAAEEAGMTRRTIHRLLKLYAIDPDIWRQR